MLVSVECAPSWLTLKDFTREYSTSRTQAWREMAAGRLVAHKFGKRVLISRENADQWAARFPIFVSRARSAVKSFDAHAATSRRAGN